MKHSLLLVMSLAVCAVSMAANVAIVTNTADEGTAEDSLTVAFVVTDSIGNVAAADSFYVALFGPSGEPVFGASYAIGAAEISSMLVGGRRVYRWAEAVADIDAGGRRGTYAGIVIAVDTLDGAGAEYLDGAASFSFVLMPSLADRIPIGDTIRREASTLVSTDRIGVDLTNVVGTLDAGEIGVAAIGNQQLGDGAISAGKIQDYAITAYKIAGSALSSSKFSDDAIEKFWECDSSRISAGMGAMLKDTAAYQGSAGSIDSAAVAGWVWNTPQANHEIHATFGDYLDAPVSALSTGTGAHAVTVISYDSTRDAVIPYAGITVHDVSHSALLAVGRTAADGAITFHLDADSCVFAAFVSGYMFTGLDTVALAETDEDTVYASWFDPGAPVSPDLCRVYGHVYGVDGLPLGGVTVTAALPKGTVRAGTVLVSPASVSTTTDADGYFTLDVIPTAALLPPDTRYEVSIVQAGGTILRKRVIVPDQSSWRLDWSDE